MAHLRDSVKPLTGIIHHGEWFRFRGTQDRFHGARNRFRGTQENRSIIRKFLDGFKLKSLLKYDIFYIRGIYEQKI